MQDFLPKVFCYVDEFNLSDLSKLSKNINIIYRNYTNIDHTDHLIKIKAFCKKSNNKLYLSNNIKMSIKLGLDGVYIPSLNKQINYCGSFNLPKNFKIIGFIAFFEFSNYLLRYKYKKTIYIIKNAKNYRKFGNL